ncbi:uncharacterized protein isoform X2 [Rhodnius prolixus]|uniref:uncharacterized protein isoform X2 n=1 Tax=Rhodnius prolixus TaxID=13249 RepID=UPI003D18B817
MIFVQLLTLWYLQEARKFRSRTIKINFLRWNLYSIVLLWSARIYIRGIVECKWGLTSNYQLGFVDGGD